MTLLPMLHLVVTCFPQSVLTRLQLPLGYASLCVQLLHAQWYPFPSHDDYLQVVRDAIAALAGKMASNSDGQNEKSPDNRFSEKCNALAGLKLEHTFPPFKDSDMNFDRHWRQFSYALDLHVIGRTGLRPIDVMTAYRRCLPAGSIRLCIFDTCVNKAQKAKRLPGDATKVMEEIKVKLRHAIRETLMQWQDRVEREFAGLVMQGKRLQFRCLRWL